MRYRILYIIIAYILIEICEQIVKKSSHKQFYSLIICVIAKNSNDNFVLLRDNPTKSSLMPGKLFKSFSLKVKKLA